MFHHDDGLIWFEFLHQNKVCLKMGQRPYPGQSKEPSLKALPWSAPRTRGSGSSPFRAGTASTPAPRCGTLRNLGTKKVQGDQKLPCLSLDVKVVSDLTDRAELSYRTT